MNYLYNGVELPELPEWDKETYPYATIQTQTSGAVRVRFSTVEYAFHTDATKLVPNSDTIGLQVVWELKDGQWVLLTPSATNMSDANISTVIWTNYDMDGLYYEYDELGDPVDTWLPSPYLAASDPIPVYE